MYGLWWTMKVIKKSQKWGWESQGRAMRMMWVLKDEKEVIRVAVWGQGLPSAWNSMCKVPLVQSLGSVFNKIKLTYQVYTIKVALYIETCPHAMKLENTLRSGSFYSSIQRKQPELDLFCHVWTHQPQENRDKTVAPRGLFYYFLYGLNCTSGEWVESQDFPA